MTVSELMSALSFGRPGFTLPEPTTLVDGDLQHLLGLYSGISTLPPIVLIDNLIIGSVTNYPLLLGSVSSHPLLIGTVEIN